MRKLQILMSGLLILTASAFGQTFEQPQIDDNEFEQVKVKIGADFAIQFQGLDNTADSTLVPLGSNLNLPTANFDIDAYLAKGVMVHLRTYLSSKHHNDTWVKGGYLIMDQLPFLHSSAVDNVMNYLTLKVGVMELNYGDEHFRRSDNAEVINNPFVGNYIMDAFTTAPGLEIMFRNPSGLIAMGGVTTGSLRPDLVTYSGSSGYTPINMTKELAVYGKIGIDKQINDDVRLRATVSGYHNKQNHFGSLYEGDRAGSRFYLVMVPQSQADGDVTPGDYRASGRWSPGFTNKDNSVMLNLFARVYGLEFFGTVEQAKGTSAFGGAEFKFNQYAAEALYHFGGEDQFYGGARYNYVKNDKDMNINRYEIAAGWDLTKNIVAKVEYVNQTYNNFISDYGSDAGFKGVMVEAGISF
jgi:hypothetical protein